MVVRWGPWGDARVHRGDLGVRPGIALCLAILVCLSWEGSCARRRNVKREVELIGWRGETHKVETAKPELGKPFVVSDYWRQNENQPLGVDQWVSWYAGYNGNRLDQPEVAELVRKRDEHQNAQPTKPCMPLSKFVEAGLAAREFDRETQVGKRATSARVFPHEGSQGRAGLPVYAHMATLALAPNGSIALAFQASHGVEGADGQRIHVAFSKGPGAMDWWPAGPVPMKQGGGEFKAPEHKFVTSAQWGPVLQEDREEGRLVLFYSESAGDCHEPASPEEGHGGRWVVGGDVRVTSLGLGASSWEPPQSIHKQSEGKVPKITANGMIVHASSGNWVLPFWRQKPRHIFIRNPETDQTTRRCTGPKGSKRRTSAAVLISADRGRNWHASAKPIESRTAGWLIENTLVELDSDSSLLMLFRTKAGAIFSCKSFDAGESWSTAKAVDTLVNTDSKVHMIKLRDGRLLLAGNDHPRPFVHDRSANELVASRERTRMVVWVSKDEGETWQRLARIDDGSQTAQAPGNFLSGLVFGGGGKASGTPRPSDFPNPGTSDPFQLRDMDESSELSTQYHYPTLMELPEGSQKQAGCAAIVAYTKSKLNVVSQKTTGHEIHVTCISLS